MFVLRPVPVRRRLAPLNAEERRRHKRRNLLHSFLLLGGMVGLLALCGLVVFGPDGVLGVALGAVLLLALSPRVSAQWVLRMYGARPIRDHDLPELARLLDELTRRAELPARPRLFYVPSRVMNAFALGGPDDAAIALTDGLLRNLSRRELGGVLAHEISHVRNNDLWLMRLADLVGAMTRAMTLAGLALLVLQLPLVLSGTTPFPWLVLPLLLFAPQIMVLMQLALSRAREFDADLDAVGLTGDVEGLASALTKLERFQRGIWERILMPEYRLPEPSVLRTHPPTEERVARLLALTRPDAQQPWDEAVLMRCPWPEAAKAPRHRLMQPWY